MTQNVDETSENESGGMEDALVSEDVADEVHVAYMTYQNAKAKCRKAVVLTWMRFGNDLRSV